MSSKLYVGGLSYSTSEDSLAQLFSQAGQVDSVRIITDRDTGRAKGFGFVEMSSEDQAQNAINLFNGTDFEGRSITVSEARPQEPRSNGGYGDNRRGGGYGNNGGGYRNRY